MNEEPVQSEASSPQCWQPMMRRRLIIVLICCSVWSAFLVGCLSHYMIFSRDKYVDQMVKTAVHERITPAMRGRIVDQKGTKYAWSVRHFDFVWQVPDDSEERQNDLRILKAYFPRIPVVRADKVVVRRNLTGLEKNKLMHLLKQKGSNFRIKSRFTRHYKPGYARKIGKVRLINGVLTGISGYEKKFNRRLRGVDKCIRFLVGEDGAIVEDSYSEISQMIGGKDVYIKELP